MRVVVEVRSPCAVVEEPGVRRRLHPLDELLGVGAPLVIEEGEHGNGDLFDLFQRPVARSVHEALVERHVPHPFGPVLAVDHLGEEVRVPPFRVHVRHRQEAVEVVEPDVLRLALFVLPHVPLADGLCHVAGVGEELGEGDLPTEAAGHAVHGRDQEAVPHREATGHDGGPGGCARRLAVTGREQQTLSGDPVDVRCRRSDRDPAAVAPEIPPADVVHQDDDHVRPSAGALVELRQLRRGRFARGRGPRRRAPGWVRVPCVLPVTGSMPVPLRCSVPSPGLGSFIASPCLVGRHMLPRSRTRVQAGPRDLAHPPQLVEETWLSMVLGTEWSRRAWPAAPTVLLGAAPLR